jgi:hypothetical protein
MKWPNQVVTKGKITSIKDYLALESKITYNY